MTVLCPRCQLDHYTPYEENWKPGDPPFPALSRTSRGPNDAPIYVCSACGRDEAMMEFFHGGAQPPEMWPVELSFTIP